MTSADPRGYTNETLGQSVEKVICDLAGLDASGIAARSSPEFEQLMRPTVIRALQHLPGVTAHLGTERGDRGGRSKSPVDFMLEGDATLSVKSNLKRAGGKVCPPDVGQPGMVVYKSFFGHLYEPSDFDSSGLVRTEAFKRVAQERIVEKMRIYLHHLFDCDYLLWTWLTPKPGFSIFRKSQVEGLDFDRSKFSFSQSPASWNESCSVRYSVTNPLTGVRKSIPLAEFQIHNHRSNFKFRVILGNLERLFPLASN